MPHLIFSIFSVRALSAQNVSGVISDADGALTQLNRIRTRAGLADASATSQADVRQAIADERRLELALEGQR